MKKSGPPYRKKKRHRFSELSQLKWAKRRKRNSGNTFVNYVVNKIIM